MPGSLTFNGTTDLLKTTIGAAGVTAAVTELAVVRPASITGVRPLVTLLTSGALPGYELYQTDASLGLYNGVTQVELAMSLGLNEWMLLAVTKAAGTVTPRFHKYVFATKTWTHTNAGGTLADGVSVAGGNVGFAHDGIDFFSGELAAAAVFSSALSDGTLEASVSFATIASASPVAFWPFDRLTQVYDHSGGGANQSSITGTVHSAREPFGFWDRGFDLSSFPKPLLRY